MPLCLGIISGLYFKPDAVLIICSSAVAISGFCLSSFFNRYLYNPLYGVALNIALFLFGLVLYSNEKNRLSDLDPSPAKYFCTVCEFPEEKEKTFSLIAEVNSKLTEKGSEPVYGTLLIHLRKDDHEIPFLPGDQLVIKCSPARIMNRGNPNEFDYRFYMENHGIKYYTFADGNDISSHITPSHIKLKYRALIIREKIIGMYRNRGITGERLALLSAITLGQKNMLEPEQKQSFIKAGIMHIMAVSGLHAVILSIFMFNILFFLKGRLGFLRIILTVIFLWLFAFVTGLTPSVLRATFMYTFLQSGKLMHRNVNSLNSVLASAFILLLIRPSVLFDAGFLLSYSAVIFIICFYSDLYRKLDFRNWLADKIWQSATVTITAQAGTLPLTISLFNRFPTWFLITNILIVPLSSVLIIIGCILPITYPLKFISFPLAKILSFLTGATAWLTKEAASLPFSTIDKIGMGNVESILLFASVFVAFRYLLDRKSLPVLFPVTLFLLFVLSGTIKAIVTRSTSELIVYNSTGSSSIGIRSGKTLLLYTDTTAGLPEIVRHCASLGLRVKSESLDNGFRYIRAGGKRILISNNISNSLLHEVRPDIIVLTGRFPKIDRPIDTGEQLNSFIITAEVKDSFYLRKSIEDQISCHIHYIKKSGAWRMRL